MNGRFAEFGEFLDEPLTGLGLTLQLSYDGTKRRRCLCRLDGHYFRAWM